jgi:site-specific DNA recombinase
MKHTAVGYIRVSTKKQQLDWESLKTQKQSIKNYSRNNNLKLVKIFEDAYTGTKADRKWLNEMYQFIENYNWNISQCIITKIDRSTRWKTEVYEWIKKTLKNLWTDLKDIVWIIQKDIQVVWNISTNESIVWEYDMTKYDWSMKNPWKIWETISVIMSAEERDAIIQRTIPREIEDIRKWYHANNSHYWFKNTRERCEDGVRRTMQVEDISESIYITELYKLRAEWIKSKFEIVDIINSMWYKSRNWKSLTVKHSDTIIMKPIYCGVLVHKYNNYVPIHTAYDWLVTVDEWNRANKWKLCITIDWKHIDILYGKGKSKEKIIHTRVTYDEEFPLRKLVYTNLEDTCFKKSKVTSKGWKRIPYYHREYSSDTINRLKLKSKSMYVPRDIFEKTVFEFIDRIQTDTRFIKIYLKVINDMWNRKMNDLNLWDKLVEKNIKKLIKDKKRIEDSLIDYIDNKNIVTIMSDKINIIDSQIRDSEKQLNNSTDIHCFNDFKKSSIYLVEHMGKLARLSRNENIIKVVFEFLFYRTPRYNEFESGTPPIYPIFSLLSQQKNSHEESLGVNLKWQPH